MATMTVGGKLQGVPISITGKLPMYNKTTFDKAGVAIPHLLKNFARQERHFRKNWATITIRWPRKATRE
ncbi:MAG: hypothetical protein ACLTZG_21440 [Hungatella hathewayi]|uniref:hypothetical protein n=1 Tax=Hungatella hathewayi TaxID=154046 RepID=UPI0039965D4D